MERSTAQLAGENAAKSRARALACPLLSLHRMKRVKATKLTLNRITVRALDRAEAARAAGGAVTDAVSACYCPTKLVCKNSELGCNNSKTGCDQGTDYGSAVLQNCPSFGILPDGGCL